MGDTVQVLISFANAAATHIGPDSFHLILTRLDLHFAWKTSVSLQESGPSSICSQHDCHPFLANAFLPSMRVLDRIFSRFVTWHLVRRYPLIFGPSGKRLAMEKSFLPSLLNSVLNIMKRSQSSAFRQNCADILERQHYCNMHFAAILLKESLETSDAMMPVQEINIPIPILTQTEACSAFLARQYRCSIRKACFKGVTCIPLSSEDEGGSDTTWQSSGQANDVTEDNRLESCRSAIDITDGAGINAALTSSELLFELVDLSEFSLNGRTSFNIDKRPHPGNVGNKLSPTEVFLSMNNDDMDFYRQQCNYDNVQKATLVPPTGSHRSSQVNVLKSELRTVAESHGLQIRNKIVLGHDDQCDQSADFSLSHDGCRDELMSIDLGLASQETLLQSPHISRSSVQGKVKSPLTTTKPMNLRSSRKTKM
ncbi:hypothetical protein BDQ17DRAFT_595109 [Cyathus striatus]|nr:hypothetical protein BDQ17DRAFT_595109 [Cyathus striatus]